MATRKAPAAKVAPVTTLTPPAIGQHWPEQGGIYAGIASDIPGGAPGHLVLLDLTPATKLSWTAATAWAAALGQDARLPTRSEALLLFFNIKSLRNTPWKWTNEAYEGDASYAWYCDFGHGFQDFNRKSYEGGAVAVRRLPLNPSVL